MSGLLSRNLEQLTPQLIGSESEGGLSHAAAAVIEFTSNVGEVRARGELTYVTSKDAYAWATIATALAEATPRIEDVSVETALFASIAEHRPAIVSYAKCPSWNLFLEDVSVRDLARLIQWSVWQRLEPSADKQAGLAQGVENPSTAYDVHRFTHSALASFTDKISSGYQSLIDAELITDPIIETSLALAVLGVTPFSIVKRTRRGQVIYRKLQAGLWKYERKRNVTGDIETNVTFEAARIARAIKVGLIAAWHSATKGEGDEPPEEP
jgi:hypothetical protein